MEARTRQASQLPTQPQVPQLGDYHRLTGYAALLHLALPASVPLLVQLAAHTALPAAPLQMLGLPCQQPEVLELLLMQAPLLRLVRSSFLRGCPQCLRLVGQQ
jgi:hypothetical protein